MSSPYFYIGLHVLSVSKIAENLLISFMKSVVNNVKYLLT